MNRVLGLIAGLVLSPAMLTGCTGGRSPAQEARANPSSATPPSPSVTARTGYARKPPASCSFLDHRPDLLAAVSAAGVRPHMRTIKGLTRWCDWQRDRSSTASLSTDVFVFASDTRQDSLARARRAHQETYRTKPCPEPVAGRPHPSGLTWEEGCLVMLEYEGFLLDVRRGNVNVTVSYYGPLAPDKRQEQACLQIAQILLESIKWVD